VDWRERHAWLNASTGRGIQTLKQLKQAYGSNEARLKQERARLGHPNATMPQGHGIQQHSLEVSMSFRRAPVPTIAASLAALFISGIAQGQGLGPGVVEINHDKAIAGNIGPQDTAGFPVTLVNPGRYVLTSNLYVPNGQTAINILGSDITLDLNGFTIHSTGKCSWTFPRTVTCGAMSATGHGGVIASGTRATVRNGTVRGFNVCVSANVGAAIHDMTLVDCNYGLEAVEGLVENTIIRQAVQGMKVTKTAVRRAFIMHTSKAIEATHSVIEGVHAPEVGRGVYGHGATPGTRTGAHNITMWAADGVAVGNVYSMKNNLCNGHTC